MHPEMARALAEERRRELARDARPWRPGRRIPRYHLTWSRMSLPGAGAAGRERSWVIVISATRGL